MPFEDQSFDAVVANEMIEHIDDPDTFLVEVEVVLRKGGTLLVSTPNKPIYNRYKPPNPFHVSEMNVAEFRRLLKRHFEATSTLSDYEWPLVSATFELEGHERISRSRVRQNLPWDQHWTNPGRRLATKIYISMEDPEYILATCSDTQIENSLSHSTIYFSTEDDLWSSSMKKSWLGLPSFMKKMRLFAQILRDVRAEVEEAKNEHELSSGEALRHLERIRSTSPVALHWNYRELGPGMPSRGNVCRERADCRAESARLELLEKSASKFLEHLEVELEKRRIGQELELRELKREYADTLERGTSKSSDTYRQQRAQRAGKRSGSAAFVQNQELEAIREQHAQELERLRTEKQRQIQEFEASREQQVQELERGRTEQQREIQGLETCREQQAQELERLRAAQQAQLQELEASREQQAQELERLRAAQQERIQELEACREQQAQELERLRAAQQEQIQELEKSRQQLAQDLETVRAEHESHLQERQSAAAAQEELSAELRRTNLRMEEHRRLTRRRDEERDEVIRAAELRSD